MPFRLTRGTWLALAALGPAIFVAIQPLPILRSVFLLLLVVALLALLINPLADRLGRRGVARGLTVALALGGTALLLNGALAAVCGDDWPNDDVAGGGDRGRDRLGLRLLRGAVRLL